MDEQYHLAVLTRMAEGTSFYVATCDIAHQKRHMKPPPSASDVQAAYYQERAARTKIREAL